MKSVYPSLILGAAIGAIIHGLVPTEWISTFFGAEHLVADSNCSDLLEFLSTFAYPV